MEAIALQAGARRPRAPAEARTHARSRLQLVATGLCGLYWLAALTLLARRLAGTLVVPLDPARFVGVVSVAAALAAGIRLLLIRSVSRPGHREAALRWLLCFPTVALAMIAVCVWLPGSSTLAMVAGTVLVVADAAWSRRGILRLAVRPDRGPYPLGTGSLAEFTGLNPPPAAPRCKPAAHVRQQFVRMRMPDGSERMEGWCRTVFAAASRHAVEHVAFCPPFAAVPQIECEVIEGPAVRLRLTRILPYGACIELRLPSPPQELTPVTFQFAAVARPAAPREGEG